MKTEKYNGYTNYETWAVCLWINNDQGLQEYWDGEAAVVWDDTADDPADSVLTRSDNARNELADRLKNEHEEQAANILLDSPARGGGLFADLLNAALSEVDWYEIADTLLRDNEECPGYKPLDA